ncbi:MAG TPA: DUF4097 family beta strand repeat-containing protein [Candidatus Deferrimicrobium sp.]|nr:DUF4097 family beta strand repeat-containing protein [Candidatus Deferrimicrobium sp.]
MRIWLAGIWAIGCLVVLPSALYGAEEHTFTWQKTVDPAHPCAVHVDLAKGSVTVTGTDEDKIVIDAITRLRAADRKESEEVADHVEIRVDTADGKVAVSTNYLTMPDRGQSSWQKVLGAGSDSYCSVDYTISLPLKSSLAIRSMAADISLSNIEGEIQIDNAAGATRAEFILGAVDIRQPQGEVDLKWVEGNIRIRSSSGRITIHQSRGSVDLSTETGDVRVQTELDSRNDFVVETGTGSITFLIPESSSGQFKIDSQTGEVRSDVPVIIKSISRNRLIGQYGQGGPTITLSSNSGNVTVAPY